MNRIRALLIAGSLVAAAVLGGAAATVVRGLDGITANAATPATSPSPGSFVSNEDPAHEKGETAAQEAAENSGQRPRHGPGGPGGAGGAFTPNEDPAHEAGESAAQEAAENAGQRPGPRPSPSSSPNA
jgi:hypothetical protein